MLLEFGMDPSSLDQGPEPRGAVDGNREALLSQVDREPRSGPHGADLRQERQPAGRRATWAI